MLAKLITALSLLAFGPAAQPASSYENLQGFSTVLVNQINQVVGTERLPSAMGLPLEPGVYVTISPERAVIFDKVAATIQGGRYADQTIAAECASGCARSIYDAFFFNWRALVEEAAAINNDVPSRVLFGVDGEIPARLLVETAYAAAETRPGTVPNMYLLLNSGQAGVRARPFFLVPPKGLSINVTQRVLGLTVKVEAGGRYTITAADPRFARTITADSKSIKAKMVDIKKRYPGKETLVLLAGDTATVNDFVGLMVAVQEQFPRVVFSNGAHVRVSG
jgi:hypothetical protein